MKRTKKRKKKQPVVPGLVEILRKFVCGVTARVKVRRPAKKLRLVESLPLGDKRFVAVIQFEREHFLIGGSANSICMLTKLDSEIRGFSTVLASQGDNERKPMAKAVGQ